MTNVLSVSKLNTAHFRWLRSPRRSGLTQTARNQFSILYYIAYNIYIAYYIDQLVIHTGTDSLIRGLRRANPLGTSHFIPTLCKFAYNILHSIKRNICIWIMISRITQLHRPRKLLSCSYLYIVVQCLFNFYPKCYICGKLVKYLRRMANTGEFVGRVPFVSSGSCQQSDFRHIAHWWILVSLRTSLIYTFLLNLLFAYSGLYCTT